MDTVKWYGWGNEAIDRARETDRPLFVWIGYRGCKACARMESETFVDPQVAEALQHSFIPVKVDRDDWPDVDRRLQNLLFHWLGRTEGWPMSAFVSPEMVPLYLETYLPPQTGGGQLGLDQIAQLVRQAYATQRHKRLEQGRKVLKKLALPTSIEATRLDTKYLKETFWQQVESVYDQKYGGFVEVPKRLHLSTLETLLVLAERFGNDVAADRVSHTVTRLYDSSMWHEAGGVCRAGEGESWNDASTNRYTIDATAMIQILLKLSVLKREDLYRQWAFELSDWLLLALRQPKGVFGFGVLGEAVEVRAFASIQARTASALIASAHADDRYRPDALGAVQTLMDRFVHGDAIVHRIGLDNPNGYLDDYATVASTLLDAYALTQNEAFESAAVQIVNEAIKRFYHGGFWRLSDGIFDDPSPWVDTDTPAPAASMITVLDRLSREVDKVYTKFVTQSLAVASYDLMRKPLERATLVQVALHQ